MNRKKNKMIPHPSGSRWREFEPLASILEDWYGREGGSAELVSHLPDPVTIRQVLDNIVPKSLSSENSDLIRLKDRWENIVGKDIANISKPKYIKNGIVYVEVSNSVWMMELRNYSKKMILGKIVSLYGCETYKDIVFVPAG